MEPSIHDQRHAAGVADSNVCRCTLRDTVADVAQRMGNDGWDWCVAVDEHDVVLGLVATHDIDETDTRTVDAVMQEGPQTARPDTTVSDLKKRMDESKLDEIIITDPDGRLLGIVLRARVEGTSVHSRA
jgi:predicted transcriptional regulator